MCDRKALRRMLFVGTVTASVLPGIGAKLSDSVPKGWIEDFELAKKTAAAEGKFVFLAFSGSDWCGWCMKLEQEVYSQKPFVAKAQKDFVLTMIDCPQNQEILSKLAREQNRPLAQTYGVRGFPTGIVCDGNGTEIGRVSGYVKGGPDAYLERMQDLVKDREPKKGTEASGSPDAQSAFSWGVPMGGAIMAASQGPDAKAVRDLTERKIKVNKDSIEKIALALKAMTEAKTEAAATRAMAAFESAVKAYHKKYVGGYGKWPLSKSELLGEQSQTAQAVAKALEAVVSATANASAKAVYEKKLETVRQRAKALEARYKERKEQLP